MADTTRIDALPENTLENLLGSIDSEIIELKNAQIVGKKSLVMNRVFNNAPEISILNLTTQIYVVEATYAPVSSSFDGNVGINSFYHWASSNGAASLQFDSRPNPIDKSTGKQTFTLTVRNLSGAGQPTNLTIQYFFNTSGSGTISARVLP